MTKPDRPATAEEKRDCVKRELGFRHRVYEFRVQQGKMKRENADRELWLMEEILKDMEELVKNGRLL